MCCKLKSICIYQCCPKRSSDSLSGSHPSDMLQPENGVTIAIVVRENSLVKDERVSSSQLVMLELEEAFKRLSCTIPPKFLMGPCIVHKEADLFKETRQLQWT